MSDAEQPTESQDIHIPKDQTIFVHVKDLPLYCPGPHSPLWSMHPRIYIEITQTGRHKCAYCGAIYQLNPGEKIPEH